MMIRRFKTFFGSCGVVVLSLYCRGVLAADAAVNANTTTATPQIPALHATQLLPTQLGNKQAQQGMLVMLGAMLIMIAVAWLLGVVMAKLAGKKPVFKKPLILGLIGFALIFISRHLAK